MVKHIKGGGMKKLCIVLVGLFLLWPSVPVFALGEEAVSNMAFEPGVDEPILNEEVGIDEGYGEDAEYFGAEVNGGEEMYTEEGADAQTNAEILNAVVQ